MKVLKFYTSTCMPCKIVGKILENFPELEVQEINAVEDLEMVDKYNVCTTPTLIFLKDDEEVGRIVGMTTRTAIEEQLAK